MADFVLALAIFVCIVIGKIEAASPGEHIFHVPEVIIQQHHHDRKSNEVLQPDDDAEHRRIWEDRKRAKEEDEHRHNQQGGVGFEVEEYFVEHEISTPQARHAARHLDIHRMIQHRHQAGCAECTHAEMDYCSGPRVLNDHCCCERRDREPFGHVPHTCYAGARACQPLVGDCAQYARLRECCCDQLVAEKWKHILSSAHSHSAFSWSSAAALSLLVFLARILSGVW